MGLEVWRHTLILIIPLFLIATGCSEEYFELNQEVNRQLTGEIAPEIEPISSPPDTTALDPLSRMKQALHDDLAVILNPDELTAFAALPDSLAVETWLTAYWLRCDPVPTTARNERRDEHYRRLEHARANYPLPEPPGYDIRGRDYILFGPPDGITERDPIIGGFYHSRRETWVWRDAEMLAEYWDFANTGHFTPAGVDAWSRNMIRHGNITDSTGDGPGDMHGDNSPGKLKRKGIYQKAVREKAVIYQHLLQEDLLWSVFAVDCLQGEGDSTQVYISYQVALAQLDFRPVMDSYSANLIQSLALADGESKIVTRLENEITLRRESPLSQAGVLYTGLMTAQVRAGEYRLTLRLKDPRGGRGQLLISEIVVPGYRPDSLAVSDICFGSALGTIHGETDAHREPTANYLVRGGSTITPHPQRIYSSGQPLRIYFEVYGLSTDRQNLTDYRVRYSIRKQGRRWRLSRFWRLPRGGDGISSAFTHRGEGGVARFPLTISAAQFDPDIYILEVKVTDRLSGAEATRQARFNIFAREIGPEP